MSPPIRRCPTFSSPRRPPRRVRCIRLRPIPTTSADVAIRLSRAPDHTVPEFVDMGVDSAPIPTRFLVPPHGADGPCGPAPPYGCEPVKVRTALCASPRSCDRRPAWVRVPRRMVSPPSRSPARLASFRADLLCHLLQAAGGSAIVSFRRGPVRRQILSGRRREMASTRDPSSKQAEGHGLRSGVPPAGR